jgi:hypothetical protein
MYTLHKQRPDEDTTHCMTLHDEERMAAVERFEMLCEAYRREQALPLSKTAKCINVCTMTGPTQV